MVRWGGESEMERWGRSHLAHDYWSHLHITLARWERGQSKDYVDRERDSSGRRSLVFGTGVPIIFKPLPHTKTLPCISISLLHPSHFLCLKLMNSPCISFWAYSYQNFVIIFTSRCMVHEQGWDLIAVAFTQQFWKVGLHSKLVKCYAKTTGPYLVPEWPSVVPRWSVIVTSSTSFWSIMISLQLH